MEPVHYPTAPYRSRGRFYHSADDPYKWVLLPSIFMYCTGWYERRSGYGELSSWHNSGLETTTSASSVEVPFAAALPKITWLGHATFLLVFPDCTILVDPVFNDLTLLFKRLHKSEIALEALPPIDVVLISHNHRDHMEQATLQYLARHHRCTFYVPIGDGRWLASWGIENFVECTWWDQHKIVRASQPTSATVTFLPARHWSQRALFDYNKSLWGSWMITHQGRNYYIAGDTAAGDHFRAIGEAFANIDVALMPIGPCEPNYWMRGSHINAEEAGRAFLTLQAKLFIPMHWGTYGFGTEHPLAPLRRLESWWQDAGDHLALDQQLCTLRMGQSLTAVAETQSIASRKDHEKFPEQVA